MTVELTPMANVAMLLFVELIVIEPDKFKIPEPEIVEVVLIKFGVVKEAALQFGFIESVFPPAIVTAPVNVSKLVPLIVDVPAFAVVIDANVFATSIFKVPPASIVIVLLTGIVLAATVLPVVIIICAFAQNTINPKAKNKNTSLK